MSKRPVNSLLGTKPNLGPFPAEQVLPWTAIIVAGAVLGSFFGLSWQWCLIFIAWGIATYWLLTGNRSWFFFARFVRTPYWLRGHATYTSPLDKQQQPQAAKPFPLRSKNHHAKAQVSHYRRGQLRSR